MQGDDARSSSNRWTRAPLVWLLLGTAVIYLVGLGAAGLYDPADGLYAEVAREMIVLRDWLTPHLNFVRYFEKPPLLYWLDAAAMEFLGRTAFAARLPTALAAVAGVGFAYGIGCELWGRRAGLAGGAVLATSLGYFIFGRIGLPDMLLVALLNATFLGFARGLLGETPHPGAVVGAWGAMALAVMTKGLLGVVFPALTIGAFVLLTRDWRLLRRMEFLRGGGLLLLVAGPWHLLVGAVNPGFTWFYFVDDQFRRYLGNPQSIDYRTLPFVTYLVIAAVWFLPWTAFLPVGIRRCWPGLRPTSREGRGSLFVLLWAAVVVGFFAACQSRQEHYSLPALPALALVVGRLWAPGGELPPVRARGLNWTWIALTAGAAALIPLCFLFGRFEHHSFYNLFKGGGAAASVLPPGAMSQARVDLGPNFGPIIRLLQAATVVLLAGVATGTVLWLRRRSGAAVATLVGALAGCLLILQHGFVLFAPERSIAQLAEIVRSEFRSGDQIVIDGPYGYFAAADFYTGQPARILDGRTADLLFGAQYPGAPPVFLDDTQFAALWRGSGRMFFFTDRPERLARLDALAPTTRILGRTGPNWLCVNRLPGPSAVR